MPIYIEDPLETENKDWNISKYAKDKENFVLRPPYQRKNVWDTPKKRELMDSFVRQLYVPPVVLRQVVIDERELRFEVVDGQQRILSIQEFFDDKFSLPDTQELREVHAGYDLSSKYYSDLHSDVTDFIESKCELSAVVFKGIQDPTNDDHQELATKVFWRLQQGERLTNIEKNHSKTYSPSRNFIVKKADNISFDEDLYESRDSNPDRHEFFTLLNRKNDRLQHLSLLARFILIELDNGPTKITGAEVTKLFDCEKDGLTLNEDLETFTDRKEISRVQTMLDLMTKLYREDELTTAKGKVEFLNKEYFIISIYTLLRELKFGNYNFSEPNFDEVRNFTHQWYKRFKLEEQNDNVIFQFKEARQQNRTAVNKRHYLIENEFWDTDPNIQETDSQRVFSRAERIKLFLESDRVCEMCIQEYQENGIGEEEAQSKARVPWSDWDADHILEYSEGGETTLDNARVLCPSHNRGR